MVCGLTPTDNSIGVEGGKAIAGALQSVPQLQQLDLSGEWIVSTRTHTHTARQWRCHSRGVCRFVSVSRMFACPLNHSLTICMFR